MHNYKKQCFTRKVENFYKISKILKIDITELDTKNYIDYINDKRKIFGYSCRYIANEIGESERYVYSFFKNESITIKHFIKIYKIFKNG